MRLKIPTDTKVEIESQGKRQEGTSVSEFEVWASDGNIHFTLSSGANSIRVCGLTLTQ